MKRALSLALLGILTSQALAQTCGPFSLTVVSPDTASFSCSQVGTSSTWNFTLTGTSDVNSDGKIECFVDVTQSSRSIGTATLVNTLGSTIELRVWIQGTTLSTRPVDVGSVVRTGSNSPVRLVLLEASDDVESISVNSIGTVELDGDLTGSIEATTGDIDSITALTRIGGGASISAANGSIGLISVPTVDGTNSDIGVVNDPVAITAGVQINDIYAYDDIWCNITVDAGEGPVGRIENQAGGIGGGTGSTAWAFGGFANISARGPEGFYCAGNFHGPLTIDADLTDPIEIAGFVDADITITGGASAPITIDGDLDADLTIQGTATSTITLNDLGNMSPAADGTITLGTDAVTTPITAEITINGNFWDGQIKTWQPFAGLINIGVSLDGDATLHFEDGLSGQTIINSLNPSTAGTWSGVVKYGTGSGTTLSGPYYSTASTTFGGGAVGLVPFNLHDEDCFPANGDLLYPNDGLITLRFYGPVDWASGFPFNITWCPNPSPSCDPTYENEHWVVYSGQGSRTIYLQYVDDEQEPTEVPTGRYYTIFPVLTGSNALLCDDLLSTSDVPVADFAYEFNTDY